MVTDYDMIPHFETVILIVIPLLNVYTILSDDLKLFTQYSLTTQLNF